METREVHVDRTVMVTDTDKCLYLDLLKKCLTRYIFGETWRPLEPTRGSLKWAVYMLLKFLLKPFRFQLVRPLPFNLERRAEGRDWPVEAETMTGLKRLDTLETCVTDVIRRQVPGDLIETGVWRGGSSIFMRAVLKMYGDTTRIVWVADSFQGLPKPDAERYPADREDTLWTRDQLAISLDEVKANFARYGLLDDQVRFLKGWFHDTLLSAPIKRLAILRLDGDLYQSTMEALDALYDKLSVGGYVIVDDYGAVPACKSAVEEFRTKHRIKDEMTQIDWTGIFWRKGQR